MSSLSNILSFIELIGSNNSDFEKEAGLPNATLGNYLKRDADLTHKNLEKISNRFRGELEEKGFHIVNIDPFGKEQFVVLNHDEFNQYIGKRGPLSQEKAQPEGQAKGIEERIREIDERTAAAQANLNKVLDNQNWISGLVGALLDRDVLREAKGNPEKAKQILDELSKKIGPDLPAFLKTGIRADGHS